MSAAPTQPQAAPAIRCTCTGCGKTLKVPARLAGKRGACPGCQQPMQIPSGTASAEPLPVLAPAVAPSRVPASTSAPAQAPARRGRGRRPGARRASGAGRARGAPRGRAFDESAFIEGHPAERCGFGRRLGALAIDVAFSLIAGVMLAMIFGALGASAAGGASGGMLGSAMGAAMGAVLGLAVGWGLYGQVELLTASSPGKKLLDMQVADVGGWRASDAQLLRRYLFVYGSGLLSILAFVTLVGPLQTLGGLLGVAWFLGGFMIFGGARQTLHDVVAGTAVYRSARVAPVVHPDYRAVRPGLAVGAAALIVIGVLGGVFWRGRQVSQVVGGELAQLENQLAQAAADVRDDGRPDAAVPGAAVPGAAMQQAIKYHQALRDKNGPAALRLVVPRDRIGFGLSSDPIRISRTWFVREGKGVMLEGGCRVTVNVWDRAGSKKLSRTVLMRQVDGEWLIDLKQTRAQREVR